MQDTADEMSFVYLYDVFGDCSDCLLMRRYKQGAETHTYSQAWHV